MSKKSCKKFNKSVIEDEKEDLINSIELDCEFVPAKPEVANLAARLFRPKSISAPPSPSPVFYQTKIKRHGSVQSLIGAFEGALSQNPKGEFSQSTEVLQAAHRVKMAGTDAIKTKCASTKRVVTRFLNQLKQAETDNTLKPSLLDLLKPKIASRLRDLENYEMELNDFLELSQITEGPLYNYGVQLVKYIEDAESDLARLSEKVSEITYEGGENTRGITPVQLLKSVSQIGSNPTNLTIDCPIFNGDDKDRLEFKNWLARFESIVKSKPNWAEEYKISYLKSKVGGDASCFIDHLDPIAGNYELCIKALKDEYLKENYIKNEYFKLLYTESPEYDASYSKTRIYVATVRNRLQNLKNHFKVDLLDEGSAGHLFLSHIIFAKLSVELQRALAGHLKTNYPTFKQILDSHGEVIDNLVKFKKSKPPGKPPSKHYVNPNDKAGNFSKPWQNKTTNIAETPTLNFAGTEKGNPTVLHCRFCNVDGHSSLYCANFVSVEARIKKCKELKICIYCTSSKHDESKCPGLRNKMFKPCKFCQSYKHVSAMCPQCVVPKPTLNNACLSTNAGQKSNYLLPVLAITMQSREGPKITFNALFDTGSSRSYINPKVAKQLAIRTDLVTGVQYEVRTFLGAGTKELGEATLLVYFPSGRYYASSIFIDDSFNVDLEVRGLSQAVANLRTLNTPLGADFSTTSDKLEINGLIGSDLIQYIDFSTVSCMSGKALKVGKNLVPFGNSEHFLYPGQVGNFDTSCRIENNYKTIISEVSCPKTLVNECLDPKCSYEDSFGPVFEDSLVERRIDRMVSCDSLGIADISDQGVSDYDKEKIAQFEKSIEITDKIYVELVWGENIDEVPSNSSVALGVLDRVVQKLERTGLLDAYNKVFFDQQKEGIIDEFYCSPKDFSKYVWIPHRPVIKDDAQTTTKIRPVFNCSLKTSPNKPSLNEASYQGINNMQNMLKLILLFRTNKYVLLGDLRQAFLQIHLKLLRDKNRFCFFLKDGNRLRCFRYNTLLFGYCCSPFILNYVIKHIAKLHPADDCSRMISDSFFVDNLVKTGNSEEELSGLYRECVRRMDAVKFDLRSCNSNGSALVQQMKDDDRYIKHGQQLDKVLGYRYSPDTDHLQIHHVSMAGNANSKRKMLSESSKLFDPLSLAGPVTVRAKQLISKLWKRKRTKNHWDETVEGELCKEWSSISSDLNGLSSIKFPRLALNDDSPMDVFIFCDASKASYGFVAYARQNGESNFLFAKPKVAPITGRSLPQLELLGAVLGSQGLLTILETFKHVEINNVFIHLDAQIVLSWLLSPALPKNQYTCNRIKDVKKLVSDAITTYNVPISFKYVPTGDNPADMLSRGITLLKFKEQLEIWLHGPDWIRGATVQWPSSEYGCLSEASKDLIMCTELGDKIEPRSPLVSFERFSKFLKLLNCTNLIFRCLKMKKCLKEETMMRLWGTTDTLEISKLHLVKAMQAEVYSQELAFLKGSKRNGIPARVREMNLFLDAYGIIRCDGRIAKNTRFDYNVIYPILLGPKEHPLTRLLVLHYHKQVQHLGIQATLKKVNLAGFRLIRAHQTVKSIIKPCFICKKFNSLSFNYPRMTDLPVDRVNLVRPYANVGVDYTGHVYVREGGQEVKYYILLMTCLCTRAIHIDLLPDQSMEQFILALVRFCNIYGIPESVYSDNAATFNSGLLVLKDVFTSDEYRQAFGTHTINHNTIPLGAPWVGSIWERSIRTVKSCLRKVISRQKLSYFRLKTVLSDIQCAINQRPLTYRCSDDLNLEVICPNDFLHPYVENSLYIKNPKGILPYSKARKVLIESLETRDSLLENFKDLWSEVYLLGLRDSYKDLYDDKFVNQVRVGDIVLLKNLQPEFVKKRQHWSLARILELIYGADGKVRSVKLLKSAPDWREKKRYPEVHPINHLFPLELSITHQPKVNTPQGQDFEELLNGEVEAEYDFSGFLSENDIDLEDDDDPIDPVDSPVSELEVQEPIDQPNVDPISEIIGEPIVQFIEPIAEPVAHPVCNDQVLLGAQAVQSNVEPVRFSSRGRKLKANTAYNDYVVD